MQKTLTSFTPAYNRAHTIGRTYESLCRQTCQDFKWLIVDDGSKDNTKELILSWITKDSEFHEISDNEFEGYSGDASWLHIHYCYKENGGLHTGYNKAIELMDTEICVCIDSDDNMPDDAVEKILSTWSVCKDKGPNVAGIIGLDYIEGKNEPIGGLFKNDQQYLHITDISRVCQHHGDIKIVCRTDLLKKFAPMPVFKGERNGNPIYLYLQVDNDYVFWIINNNLCNVDYQDSGMSANIFNQYYNSPHNFAALRELIMSQKRLPFSFRFRNAVHFGSSIIFTSEFYRLFKKPLPLLKLLAFPFAIILNIYIRFRRL